jgi:hypothetical protein
VRLLTFDLQQEGFLNMRMDQHIKRLIEKYTYEASRQSKYEALESYSLAYSQARELGNAFTLRACAANLGAM